MNATWEELGKRLRDLQHQTAKILNYGMTEFWMWQVEKEKIKQKTGKYPTNKELSHPGYDNSRPIKVFIKKEFPDFPSNSTSAIAMFLKSRWGSDCKDVFYYNKKSLSTFKKGFPILISNVAYKLNKKENFMGTTLTITLAGKKHEGVKRFEILLKTAKMNKGPRQILDRLLSKKYKQGELKIHHDSRKKLWYCNIAYTFEPKKHSLNPDILCGIDLGVAVPFYAAITDSYQRLYPSDGMEVMGFKRQIKKRREQMQKQLKFSGRGGHGRKSALKPLEKLQQKINNFRDNKYHLYTKKIIEFCIKNQAGTIQMEDLSELMDEKQHKEGETFLKDWSISSFYEKLEYKAKEAGIVIKKVNPRYTSQRCSKCGYIDRDNRKSQSEFVCLECDYKSNADYNAAQNLAIPFIDEIITKEIEKR